MAGAGAGLAGVMRRLRGDHVVAGRVTRQATGEDRDALLDQFMPTYDVAGATMSTFPLGRDHLQSGD